MIDIPEIAKSKIKVNTDTIPFETILGSNEYFLKNNTFINILIPNIAINPENTITLILKYCSN